MNEKSKKKTGEDPEVEKDNLAQEAAPAAEAEKEADGSRSSVRILDRADPLNDD